MKKFLLVLSLVMFSLSCAPLAEFVEYDIYSNYGFIYNEDLDLGKHFPPVILEKGESYVLYLGNSQKSKRLQGETIIYINDKIFPICGKLDIRNGTRIYMQISNTSGLAYEYHIIFNGKRYMQSNR